MNLREMKRPMGPLSVLLVIGCEILLNSSDLCRYDNNIIEGVILLPFQ